MPTPATPPPVIGAEAVSNGVHFRVWAPKRRSVEVVLTGKDGDQAERTVPLTAERNGYFSGLAAGAGAGDLYRYRLDGADLYPDPASRFQPQGPHGPSCVVDPRLYDWQDGGWKGVAAAGAVLYEMHIGAFTPEGTWEAAARELPELARLGITCLEVMPVAEFPGTFGWGYDGVGLFAPSHIYGTPDDLRRFVDRAHAAGLGVILDVVYNHLGPDGNYLKQFSDHYFTDRYTNDWGEALNFEDPESGPVRDFYIANGTSWIMEYHFDGLRLDATQDVKDASPEHILAAVARAVREAGEALGGRATYLIAENEPQHTRLVQPPERGGYGLDALWNDDFHHTAVVALTGRREAYYSDYCGTPQELISAVKYGYLYQGQRYSWQEKRRGTSSLHLPRTAFVSFLQNHDQVANSARGARIHVQTSPGELRAMTALLLLAPATPMLFMGQEFCASAPFLYFADHTPELARAVKAGREEFLSQFPSLAAPELAEGIADPAAPETFRRCTLDLAERATHAAVYALHEDLLRLRREDPVFSTQGRDGIDGAVLGADAFVLRFFASEEEREDRILLINLGHDLHLVPAPEPLLAPPEEMRWEVLWSSESPRYGGSGAPPPDDEEKGWLIPGRAATVLRPVSREDRE
ncbi:MAG TPA: malto-oligosyltrehalose trehalohydrolase [Thermoanaerobaculia bacterium]|jgi:maltooligosyltrehalose trehalohydrolase|nr:malto-oligosyltrehalose trehalohydrolase [Thermoanaerobaculia bacterium]